MFLSYIWVFWLVISILFSVGNGSVQALSPAIFHGAAEAIRIAMSMAGSLCLWSGVSRVMDAGGITATLERLLRPLLRFLFPEAARDKQAAGYLCGNMAANLLGLGNAATPMGIAAVRRMQTLRGSHTASDEMCRLIVLNTASIQLIPTTVAAIRAGLGAARPFDLLPAVWVSSLCSAGAGVAAAYLFGKLCRG